jgi:RNA polymerase sigma-70 factor (ECF subfamily)
VSGPEPHRQHGDPSAAQRQLIARIRRSDTAALAELYDDTSSQIFGVVLRIVGDRAAAEEITSDVYRQVWTQAGKFDGARGSLWSWLMLIARSRAIDFLRSKLSRSREREQDLDTAILNISDRMPNPEEQLLVSDRRQVVLAAMRDLGPEKRRALEMAYFLGLTHSEIAEQLGAPLGTVKTHIRSGLAQLRAALGSQSGVI